MTQTGYTEFLYDLLEAEMDAAHESAVLQFEFFGAKK